MSRWRRNPGLFACRKRCRLVRNRLRNGWGPEQIAGRLRRDGSPLYVCKESIYPYLQMRRNAFAAGSCLEEGQCFSSARELHCRRALVATEWGAGSSHRNWVHCQPTVRRYEERLRVRLEKGRQVALPG